MSRNLKRVPLDFDWPLNIIWKGYLNPYSPTDCKLCGASGYNKETRRISDDWYDFANTGRKWCYKLTQDEVDALWKDNRLRNDFDKKPTAEEVNKWAQKGMGHDGVNCWTCVEIRAKRLGVCGKCPLCKGSGYLWCDNKYAKLWDDWKPIEPPRGRGYQLWEDCSEGGPVSLVFKTLKELCVYCEEHCTTFGSQKTTKENWFKMLSNDHMYHQEGHMVFM